MEKEALKFARKGLRIFSDELTPEYQENRAHLLGMLAAHNTSLSDLKEKDLNERSNVNLLTEFVKLLPIARVRNQQWEFELEDPYEVRCLQSNVVWVNEGLGYIKRTYTDVYSYRPYIVLGKNINTDQILVTCVGSKKESDAPSISTPLHNRDLARDRYGKVFVIALSREDERQLKNLEELAGSDYPQTHVVEAMFDQDIHKLIVSGNSQGSIKVNGAFNVDLRHKRLGKSLKALTHLPDVELAAFETNSYMDRIATEFGVVEELDAIYREYIE
jgi:hypothetical protein